MKLNGSFFYLGRHYALEIIEAPRRGVLPENGRLRVFTDGEPAANILRAWYEGMAHQLFKTRVAHYEKIMELRAAAIRIKTLKSLWGSCAASGNLCFNARLLAAPLEVVDYVVVHELAHLRHPNHSFKFWEEVSRVIPDHKEKRRWLRKNVPFLKF